jgi:hypothetical protein
MAKVHPGATLTPHFRDFLPEWIARRPWYQGSGPAPISAVGFLRFEDPAGEVGMETHLVRCGERIYQIPMTYRGAPLDRAAPEALIAVAEHSVLGRRWIYDAPADPLWVAELIRLIRTESDAEPGSKRGVAPARARGSRSAAPWPPGGTPDIEVRRVLDAEWPVDETGVLGTLNGTWYPGGPDTPGVSGRIAYLRTACAPAPGRP